MRNAVLISRRSFLLAAGLTAAAMAFAGCSAQSNAVSTSAQTVQVNPEPFLTADSLPSMDGSTACIPLIAQIMADTAGVDLTEAQSSITVSTTAYAWSAMEYDEEYSPDLLIVYEAPEYVQQELADAGTQLEKKAIGRDALVFIVNEDNPVKSLTQEQLREIYAGHITNWNELGGADSEIIAFQRSEDSGSQTLFKKLLIGDNELMTAPTELAPTDMGALIDSVAVYNNSANAIGFSVYYYVDQMYSQPGLRLLAVDGVMPSNDTISDGSYPLCNEFYAVIRTQEAADSPARQVYDWLSTDEGLACIEKSGYVAAAAQ